MSKTILEDFAARVCAIAEVDVASELIENVRQSHRIGDWIRVDYRVVPDVGVHKLRVAYLRVYKDTPFIGTAEFEYGDDGAIYWGRDPRVTPMKRRGQSPMSASVLRYIIDRMQPQWWKAMGIDPKNPYKHILCLIIQDDDLGHYRE